MLLLGVSSSIIAKSFKKVLYNFLLYKLSTASKVKYMARILQGVATNNF
jgi:hypothetical protein